ncbi:TPA: hypothetical protein ACWMHC_005045 [Klebsiella pneumoniae]|jgi:hypothetical protein
MIIEETENAYDMHVTEQELEDGTPVVELYQVNGYGVESFIGIDKHQAAQLIEVLQRWIDGEEIE